MFVSLTATVYQLIYCYISLYLNSIYTYWVSRKKENINRSRRQSSLTYRWVFIWSLSLQTTNKKELLFLKNSWELVYVKNHFEFLFEISILGMTLLTRKGGGRGSTIDTENESLCFPISSPVLVKVISFRIWTFPKPNNMCSNDLKQWLADDDWCSLALNSTKSKYLYWTENLGS